MHILGDLLGSTFLTLFALSPALVVLLVINSFLRISKQRNEILKQSNEHLREIRDTLRNNHSANDNQ